jgi:hypothetical protein
MIKLLDKFLIMRNFSLVLDGYHFFEVAVGFKYQSSWGSPYQLGSGYQWFFKIVGKDQVPIFFIFFPKNSLNGVVWALDTQGTSTQIWYRITSFPLLNK